MNKKISINNLKKLGLYFIAFIIAVLLFGVAYDLIRASLTDNTSSPVSSSNEAEYFESDYYETKLKTEIVLADKKQEYLNCIKSSDIINSYELIQEIYNTTSITFDTHHPSEIQPVIDELTNEKCGNTVAQYEAVLEEYINASNELGGNSPSYLPKSLNFEKITLSREARDTGEYVISVDEVLSRL